MESARCKAFLISAETGSFSKAAQVLNYTPSGVSQLVTALEKELGFALLHRSKKGVILTVNGKIILPMIRDYLLKEKNIYETASKVKGFLVGDITIGAYSSIATHWLPKLIKVFKEKYPQIKLHIMEGIHQEVTEWLEHKRVDVAFLSYKEGQTYDWIPLGEDEMLAVLPKEHPLAFNLVYPLQKCVDEDFIMPALGYDQDVVTLVHKYNLELKIKFSTLENFAAMAMIEEGLGMSIMNELITRKFQFDVAKLPLEPPQKIMLGMAVSSLKNLSPTVKEFIRNAEIVLRRN